MSEDNNKLSYPESVTCSFEYQKEHFWRCRYTASNVTSVYYKILLPLNVKPISIKPGKVAGTDNLHAIGCYQTIPASEYPFMEIDVVYEHVDNEMNASDWAEYIFDLLDEKILHREEYYSASGRNADFLTKKYR